MDAKWYRDIFWEKEKLFPCPVYDNQLYELMALQFHLDTVSVTARYTMFQEPILSGITMGNTVSCGFLQYK